MNDGSVSHFAPFRLQNSYSIEVQWTRWTVDILVMLFVQSQWPRSVRLLQIKIILTGSGHRHVSENIDIHQQMAGYLRAKNCVETHAMHPAYEYVLLHACALNQ